MHFFIVFPNFNHLLKLKLQIKICLCPVESMHCLKKCPDVHPVVDKCYREPLPLKRNIISAECARCLQNNYNIPIPANKCSIPFLRRVTFLRSNALCFCRNNSPTMKHSFKRHTMPFGGMLCAFPDVEPSFRRSHIPDRQANVSAQYSVLLTYSIPLKSATCLKLCALLKYSPFASYNRI